jgi:PAS domain S-box-containing protein
MEQKPNQNHTNLSQKLRFIPADTITSDDLLDHISDAFAKFDLTGQFTYVNHQAELLLGKKRSELIGRKANKVFPPLKNSLSLEAYNQSIKTNSQVIFDEYFPFLDKWLSVQLTTNKDGTLVSFHDITEQKRVEDELKQHAMQQQIVAELGQKALSGIPLIDLMNEAIETLCQTLNVEFAKIVKLNSSEKELLLIAGYGWKGDLVDKVTLPAGKQSQAGYTLLINKPVIVADAQKEKRFTITSLMKKHNVRSGVSVIISGDDKPFGVLGIHTKQLRHFKSDEVNFIVSIAHIVAIAIARRTNERRKDEFLSVASHELKTPLTSIKAFTQLLERYFGESEDQKAISMLSKMNNQIDKLTNLVEDLLDISRIEAGKMVFNPEKFDLGELIESVIEEIQPTSSHIIHKHITKNVYVYADKYRIGQVITNLLTNAIKYSPMADRIELKLSKTKTLAKLSVQDFGIGIPKDQQEKIFQRFYRVEGRGRESYPGLGLGLHISSEIVARHNGKLWLESGEGKGSTFYCTLPFAKSPR